jgi:general secretion pathway protein H
MRSRSCTQGGFTLIELIVVMVIGVMLVALVPPLFSGGVSSAEFKSSARRLAAGLRQARSHAIAYQEPAALTLDLEQRRFEITGSKRAQQLPEQLEIELFTAKSELIDGKRGSIRFYPDGSSTGGRITLTRGESKYEVDVSWLTGRVKIY